MQGPFKNNHYQYNKRESTLKLSYPLNSQMSTPINTTTYLIVKSPYGVIRAIFEYTHEEITLTFSYTCKSRKKNYIILTISI